MNQYDKTRFDVISHLTDIPLLGKQYVPGLWKQFEGESTQQQSIQQRSEREPINQRSATSTMTAQATQRMRLNTSSQAAEGFCRTTEKRPLPNSSNSNASSFAAPLSKVPRIEKRWC